MGSFGGFMEQASPGELMSKSLGVNNKFNVASPYDTQALQNEMQNRSDALVRQQQLANTLANQAAGNGPSPTQTMLNQAMQQNQGAAMAAASANRGMNSGLAMRQALQAQNQGAQQGRAQASIARQQEQLNAQGQLGNLVNTMGNQALSGQQMINQANLGAQSINANVAAGNQQMKGSLIGGLFGGMGAAMQGASGGGMAHGGMVQHFMGGGEVAPQPVNAPNPVPVPAPAPMPMPSPVQAQPQPQAMAQPIPQASPQGAPASQIGPQSQAGKFLTESSASIGGGQQAAPAPTMSLGLDPMIANGGKTDNWGGEALKSGMLAGPKMAGKAGRAMMGGGMAHGGLAGAAIDFRPGGHVPGQASVPGDSYKNDTVPAMVSPGEIVIPRSIATSKDAPEKAKRFVEAILAGHHMRKKK